jgi:hypothetical protein
MTMTDKENGQDKFGYYFFPKRYPHAPGYPRLDVNLIDAPTRQHFDPEHLDIPVAKNMSAGQTPRVQVLKIVHPWTLKGEYKVCAGPVVLTDRVGKEVEVFSFGGDLHIQLEENHTSCSHESPAPILEIKGGEDISRILAEEMEVILAERRAAWIPNEEDFDRRLAKADPLELYIACLDFLREKYEKNSHKELPHTYHFLNFIHEEIDALRKLGSWPFLVPRIDKLL